MGQYSSLKNRKNMWLGMRSTGDFGRKLMMCRSCCIGGMRPRAEAEEPDFRRSLWFIGSEALWEVGR